MDPHITIIIPARNDAGALRRTLDYLGRLPDINTVETIVAASGEDSETERALAGRGRLLWPDASTRAALMNAGAAVASGEIFFFLHADSFPPPGALNAIRAVLRDERVVGGAFEHRFEERLWKLRLISWMNRIRYRFTRNYYGDQGIFVRAGVFRRMGGYREIALMEDLDLSQRLKKLGRTELVHLPMLTAGRRFLSRGTWRTFMFILWLIFLHTLRLDTQRYADRWRANGMPTKRAASESGWPPSRSSPETR